MTGIIITLHVIACVLLITIILIQRGRGGGLLETFSGVESLFGTKTSSFFGRTTSVLAIIFFITCLTLAFLSARQSRSLLRSIKTQQPLEQDNITVTQPIEDTTQREATQKEAPAEQAQTSVTEEGKPEAPKAE